jgi:Uma2 family endonuclease
MEQANRRVSLEEYECFNAAAPARPHLEYRDGYIVAMSEPSGNHEQISVNLAVLFAPAVRTTGCKLIIGHVKLVCPNGDRTVPDIGVTCDPRDREALGRSGEARIEHPWLLVEILSPSTAHDDRSDKLDAYNGIPELTHYILIDSRKQWMLVHVRTADGLLAINGPLESFTVPNLCELTIDGVYRDTTVPRVL